MANTYTALREALAAGPTIGKLSVYHDHGWLVIGDERENVYLQVSKGTGVAKLPTAQAIAVAVNAAPALLAERDALAAKVELLRRELSEARHGAEIDRAAASQLADQVERLRADAERLDFVASEYLRIDPFDMPTGQGDADVGWRIQQYHEGPRGIVTLAEHFRDDLRAAIDAAREAANV